MPKGLGSGDVIRVLQAHGFLFVSHKVSHAKYSHGNGHTPFVPYPMKDLPLGTTLSIIRLPGLLTKDCGF